MGDFTDKDLDNRSLEERARDTVRFLDEHLFARTCDHGFKYLDDPELLNAISLIDTPEHRAEMERRRHLDIHIGDLIEDDSGRLYVVTGEPRRTDCGLNLLCATYLFDDGRKAWSVIQAIDICRIVKASAYSDREARRLMSAGFKDGFHVDWQGVLHDEKAERAAEEEAKAAAIEERLAAIRAEDDVLYPDDEPAIYDDYDSSCDPDRVMPEGQKKRMRVYSERPKWIWCLVGNVVDWHHAGLDGHLERGAKHFRPGARLYCMPPAWGDGYERAYVFGLHRRGGLRCVVMGVSLIENFRLKKVYSPSVIRAIYSAFAVTPEDPKFVPWGQSDDDKRRILSMVESLTAERAGTSEDCASSDMPGEPSPKYWDDDDPAAAIRLS